MKTMKWLIRREFWEHKGILLWVPLLIAGIISALMLLVSFKLSRFPSSEMRMVIDQVHSGATDVGATMMDATLNAYLLVEAPFLVALTVLVFFYCLSALYDERRDRSILFWKSLPVSDQLTVFSKLAVALGMLPAIAVVLATLTAFFVLLVVGMMFTFNGVNLLGPLLSHSALYLAPLQIFGLLPVYVLWALPTVGWLLLVSSWARSKPFLWALGAPGMLLLLLTIVEENFHLGWNVKWFATNIIARGLLGTIPGSWIGFERMQPEMWHRPAGWGVDLSRVLELSWASLASPQLWYGVVISAAMIYGAIRMRRWREAA
ncbi:MAG: hypothetical protein HYZ65_03610 [Burkholderiales bacterium]|nr:hypothetical protein [Burkholderiales bacterium]